MKQPLVLALIALSVLAFTPSHTRDCDSLNDDLLFPIHHVLDFLKLKPEFSALKGPGCLYILRQMSAVPHAAELLRQQTRETFPNASDSCLFPVSSIQYVCGEGARCLPQSYSYCGQWEYSMTYDPTYELAMELSYKADVAYGKAQALCGLALSSTFDSMNSIDSAMTDLMGYLEREVLTRGDRLNGLICKSR